VSKVLKKTKFFKKSVFSYFSHFTTFFDAVFDYRIVELAILNKMSKKNSNSDAPNLHILIFKFFKNLEKCQKIRK
jgi:hypothetical protein